MPEPEEIDPGTPMADVNPHDLDDIDVEGCGAF
jgi:hypothetical protein